jgi:hypothetical protein
MPFYEYVCPFSFKYPPDGPWLFLLGVFRFCHDEGPCANGPLEVGHWEEESTNATVHHIPHPITHFSCMGPNIATVLQLAVVQWLSLKFKIFVWLLTSFGQSITNKSRAGCQADEPMRQTTGIQTNA